MATGSYIPCKHMGAYIFLINEFLRIPGYTCAPCIVFVQYLLNKTPLQQPEL